VLTEYLGLTAAQLTALVAEGAIVIPQAER
jgi:hypothetical protein